MRFFILACIMLLLASGARAEPVQFTLDMAQPGRAQNPMVGFLHAMDKTNPPDAMVTLLKPTLWRAGELSKEIYRRAVGFGAVYTVVLSDFQHYGERDMPYHDYAAYEAKIRTIVRETALLPMAFDIWNEPNGRDFWKGDEAQFFETFKRAHDAIRAERPGAYIVGPSINRYDPAFITRFLDYCLANNIKLHGLSWHEYRSGAQTPEISRSLIQARSNIMYNPKYAAIGIKEIHINEGIDSKVQYSPAASLAYMQQMELGRADASARSGFAEDWEKNLGGLLTPKTFLPRSVWWAYKWYADGTNSRMICKHANDAGVFCLASKNQILLGNYGTEPVSAELQISSLPKELGDTLNFTVAALTDSGKEALALPPKGKPMSAKIREGNAIIAFTSKPDEVYLLKLAPTKK